MRGVAKDANLIIGELSDRELLANVRREHKVSGVMHFAASIETGKSRKVAETYFRNNTADPLALLESMLECGASGWFFLARRLFMAILKRYLIAIFLQGNPNIRVLKKSFLPLGDGANSIRTATTRGKDRWTLAVFIKNLIGAGMRSSANGC